METTVSPCGEAGVGGLDDGAGEVDADGHRVLEDDAAVGRAGQSVLVVEVGPLDGDGDIAVGQICFVEGLDARGEIVIVLVDHKRSIAHGCSCPVDVRFGASLRVGQLMGWNRG